MDRIPIRSTNIKEVGYDIDSNTLEIAFTDGAIYCYLGVPKSIHDGLISAASAGQYFHRMIRDKYRFTRE
jgi:KTSC domain